MAHVRAVEEYDCVLELSTCRNTWSPHKNQWCCTYQNTCCDDVRLTGEFNAKIEVLENGTVKKTKGAETAGHAAVVKVAKTNAAANVTANVPRLQVMQRL